jgi:hypothetical protein
LVSSLIDGEHVRPCNIEAEIGDTDLDLKLLTTPRSGQVVQVNASCLRTREGKHTHLLVYGDFLIAIRNYDV